MTDKIKGVAAATAAIAALAVGGAAIAGASGNGNSNNNSPQAQSTASQSSEPAESSQANEGPDQAIGGSALDQASAAALAHEGGGQITGTEVGDEQSYYEVEVTRDDGTQVDVQLDRAFNVVSSSADHEG